MGPRARFSKAVLIARTRLGHDAEQALNDAVRDGDVICHGQVINHNLKIGMARLDYVPELDPEQYRRRIHDNREVEFTSLDRWLDELAGSKVAQPAKAGHRPRGTGFEAADAHIIKEMRTLIIDGKAGSPTGAARMIIGRDGNGALGSGTPESKIRRLVRGYKKAYRGG